MTVILGCIFLDCLSYSYTIYEGKKAFRRLGDVPYAPNRRKQVKNQNNNDKKQKNNNEQKKM